MATIQDARDVFSKINNWVVATDQKHEFVVEFERRLALFWGLLSHDLQESLPNVRSLGSDTQLGESAEGELTWIKRWIYKRDPIRFIEYKDL